MYASVAMNCIVSAAVVSPLAGASLSTCLSASDAATKIKTFGSAVSPSHIFSLTPNNAQGVGAALMKLSFATPSPLCSSFSFSTSFSCSLFPGDGVIGQGFTFTVLLNATLGDGGPQMGYGGGSGHSFAVEVDGRPDPWDPPYRHVGINIGRTVVSAATQPASVFYNTWEPLNFLWVDLDPVSHTLSLFIGKSSEKPVVATLSAFVDVCKALGLSPNDTLPPVYAGFTSSANDAAYGTHAVCDWSITTSEWATVYCRKQPVPCALGKWFGSCKKWMLNHHLE